MKVKDLLLELSHYNEDADIFMSRDAEGNGFANIECAETHDEADNKTAKKVVLWPMHEQLDEV